MAAIREYEPTQPMRVDDAFLGDEPAGIERGDGPGDRRLVEREVPDEIGAGVDEPITPGDALQDLELERGELRLPLQLHPGLIHSDLDVPERAHFFLPFASRFSAAS